MGRLGGIAVTVAVLALLSGCSVIGDIGRTGESLATGAAIDAALGQAREQLEAIDGVTVTESSSELTVDYDYSVSLVAVVDDPATPHLGAILEIARSTLGGEAFGSQTYFSLSSGDTSVASLDYFGLTAAQLADEVAYVSAFQEAYGLPVSLGISAAAEAGAGYSRSLYSSGSGGALGALAAVPDSSAAAKFWSLPGIDVEGSFPGPAVMELLSDIGTVASIVDNSSADNFDGVQLHWYDSGRLDVTYASSSLVEGVPFAGTADWNSFLAVVALATAADLPLHYLSYYNPAGLPGGSVNLAGCAEDGTPSAGDLELLAATGLAASAGYCYRELDT